MTKALPTFEINQHLEDALAAQRTVTQAMRLTSPHVGQKLLVFSDGSSIGSLGSDVLNQAVQQDAISMMAQASGKLARSNAYPLADGTQARIFIEVFFPPPHLVIFGGVHIAVPLVKFAKMLGFDVTLADPRATFANRERFPDVDHIIP